MFMSEYTIGSFLPHGFNKGNNALEWTEFNCGMKKMTWLKYHLVFRLRLLKYEYFQKGVYWIIFLENDKTSLLHN